MKKTWNRALIVTAGIGLASLLLAPSAFAAKGKTGRLGSEVDNGVSWTLATRSSHLSSAVQSSYADAGVVADIGTASSFNGIFATGSGPLADNIWIGDGSQAFTSGNHPFASDPPNFSYGFDNHDGTFYMATGPQAGQALTIAQIQTDFAGFEAYAWVGVVYGGTSVKGTVNSINGHRFDHRSVSVTPKDGILTAAVK